MPGTSLPVTLRPYRDADAEAIVALWYRTWHEAFPDLRHPYPLAAWESRFHEEIAPREAAWVAEAGGRIVGFLALIESDGYVDQIFVESGAQRLGVGSTLMAKAKALCPGGLRLHTLAENRQARAFYERHGFRAGARGINAHNGRPNVEYRS